MACLWNVAGLVQMLTVNKPYLQDGEHLPIGSAINTHKGALRVIDIREQVLAASRLQSKGKVDLKEN